MGLYIFKFGASQLEKFHIKHNSPAVLVKFSLSAILNLLIVSPQIMTKWAQEQINARARACVQCCSCTHGQSARAPNVVQAYGQCHEPRYEFNVLKGNLVKEKAIVLKQVSLPG